MSRPARSNLTKAQQKIVLSKFKGSKTEKPMLNARKISNVTGFPRHHVMAFLEEKGLRTYSDSSYK